MDMTSAFAAAGYDLQAFDASDMAYGTDRLLSDVMTATGPSIASNLYTTENEALLARSTSWSRNRISNGMNTIVEEAGKKIGFFSLASIGNSAQTKELTAADLALAASEQVAALQAQGADAILCIALGRIPTSAAFMPDLADLGVTAVWMPAPQQQHCKGKPHCRCCRPGPAGTAWAPEPDLYGGRHA